MAAKKKRSASKAKKTVTLRIDEATLREFVEAVKNLQALAMGVEQFIQEPTSLRDKFRKRKAKKRTKRGK